MKYLKYIVGAIIVLVIGVGIGLKLHAPKLVVVAGASPVGTTNTTPTIAQQILNGNGTYDSGANAYVLTSSSTPLCNTDSSDRVVNSIDVAFLGLTTVSTSTALQSIQIATSSSNTQIQGNTNYLLSTTFSTSTSFNYISTTTPGLVGTTVANRIWASGSCLAIQSNATTSGTVIVRVGVVKE